jgi:hypothetical protein
LLHQPESGFFNTFDGDFKHRSQCRASLDEQVDVLPVQTDHVRQFFGYPEAELLDVERRCALGVFRLNENIRAKAVCHVAPSNRFQ